MFRRAYTAFRNWLSESIWPDLALIFAIVVLMLVIAGTSGGCSATSEASKATSDVRRHATDIRGDVIGAREDLKSGNTAGVDKRLGSIDGHAAAIQQKADYVQEKLTQVQDRVPWWASLIKWSIVGFLVIVGIFLLWRFDIFLLAEKVIQKIVDRVAKWIGA